MKRWTGHDDDLLTQLYPHHANSEIARLLGCTVPAVKNRARSLGLRKPIASTNTGCFQPGQTPWNKGTHFVAGGRSAETRFKPGARPHTWRPIGTDRLSKEGYLQVKLRDTGCTRRDYIPVHHLVWELHRGPIPAGMRVTFRDGDKTRIAINNLELVSIADMMRRNSYHNRYPKEIGLAIQLRGQLIRKINRAQRDRQGDSL